jgi:phosphopentomutase
MYKRIFITVLDSVGIGNALDAKDYGDEGTNTLGNLCDGYDLKMPNMEKMGLGNIYPLSTIKPVDKPEAFHAHMRETATGKDTLTGHWEFMGATLKKPFKNFCENGFPSELINEFEKLTGRKVIGNKEANGMKIISELGPEHEETGALIVYTSVDSTFQIAANENVVPIEELYEACIIARKLTAENDDWKVARVIARPYIGSATQGKFERTSNRHDYALDPINHTVLDYMKEAGKDVISVGKISDIFNGNGITKAYKSKNNMDGVDIQIEIAQNEDFEGLCFNNLVEFDSLYGHPRNPEGYKKALEEFDARVVEIRESFKPGDLWIIVADHGNDPTYKGNDHTREHVPLIVFDPTNINGKQISNRMQFSDLGATVADNFKVKYIEGKSFLSEVE